MRRSFRLQHARAPFGAGVSRSHGDDHLITRRDVIQPLGVRRSVATVLADLDHVAATARADDAARRDHTLDARQAFRQGACLALRAAPSFPGSGRAGRDLFLDGGNLFVSGLGDGRLEVLQRQFQLRRVQLLRFRPELGAPVVLNLALQLLDQRLQVADEGVLLGHHRLLVLACRALDSRNVSNRAVSNAACWAAKAVTTSGGRSGNWLRSKGCDMALATRARRKSPTKQRRKPA